MNPIYQHVWGKVVPEKASEQDLMKPSKWRRRGRNVAMAERKDAGVAFEKNRTASDFVPNDHSSISYAKSSSMHTYEYNRLVQDANIGVDMTSAASKPVSPFAAPENTSFNGRPTKPTFTHPQGEPTPSYPTIRTNEQRNSYIGPPRKERAHLRNRASANYHSTHSMRSMNDTAKVCMDGFEEMSEPNPGRARLGQNPRRNGSNEGPHTAPVLDINGIYQRGAVATNPRHHTDLYKPDIQGGAACQMETPVRMNSLLMRAEMHPVSKMVMSYVGPFIFKDKSDQEQAATRRGPSSRTHSTHNTATHPSEDSAHLDPQIDGRNTGGKAASRCRMNMHTNPKNEFIVNPNLEQPRYTNYLVPDIMSRSRMAEVDSVRIFEDPYSTSIPHGHMADLTRFPAQMRSTGGGMFAVSNRREEEGGGCSPVLRKATLKSRTNKDLKELNPLGLFGKARTDSKTPEASKYVPYHSSRGMHDLSGFAKELTGYVKRPQQLLGKTKTREPTPDRGSNIIGNSIIGNNSCNTNGHNIISHNSCTPSGGNRFENGPRPLVMSPKKEPSESQEMRQKYQKDKPLPLNEHVHTHTRPKPDGFNKYAPQVCIASKQLVPTNEQKEPASNEPLKKHTKVVPVETDTPNVFPQKCANPVVPSEHNVEKSSAVDPVKALLPVSKPIERRKVTGETYAASTSIKEEHLENGEYGKADDSKERGAPSGLIPEPTDQNKRIHPVSSKHHNSQNDSTDNYSNSDAYASPQVKEEIAHRHTSSKILEPPRRVPSRADHKLENATENEPIHRETTESRLISLNNRDERREDPNSTDLLNISESDSDKEEGNKESCLYPDYSSLPQSEKHHVQSPADDPSSISANRRLQTEPSIHEYIESELAKVPEPIEAAPVAEPTKEANEPQPTEAALEPQPTEATTALESPDVVDTKLGATSEDASTSNGSSGHSFPWDRDDFVKVQRRKSAQKKGTIVVNTKLSRCERVLIHTCVNNLKWKKCNDNISKGTFHWVGSNLNDFDHYTYTRKKKIINRIPSIYMYTRKKALTFLLSHLSFIYPELFDFYPTTFVLPENKHILNYVLSKNGNCSSEAGKEFYIMKPDNGSMGIGVKLISRYSDINTNILNGYNSYIIQKYIDNPLLMYKKKFDFRIYILLIPDKDYPKIFLSRIGFARLCTEEYKNKRRNMGNTFVHLTNYSINKDNKKYIRKKNIHDKNNNKQLLSDVFIFLKNNGYDTDDIWQQIKKISCLTSLAIYSYLKTKIHLNYRGGYTFYQLIGLDILLDDMGKAWLLEVNSNPSLRIDYTDPTYSFFEIQLESMLDRYVKEPVISEMFYIVYKYIYLKHFRKNAKKVEALTSGRFDLTDEEGGNGASEESDSDKATYSDNETNTDECPGERTASSKLRRTEEHIEENPPMSSGDCQKHSCETLHCGSTKDLPTCAEDQEGRPRRPEKRRSGMESDSKVGTRKQRKEPAHGGYHPEPAQRVSKRSEPRKAKSKGKSKRREYSKNPIEGITHETQFEDLEMNSAESSGRTYSVHLSKEMSKSQEHDLSMGEAPKEGKNLNPSDDLFLITDTNSDVETESDKERRSQHHSMEQISNAMMSKMDEQNKISASVSDVSFDSIFEKPMRDMDAGEHNPTEETDAMLLQINRGEHIFSNGSIHMLKNSSHSDHCINSRNYDFQIGEGTSKGGLLAFEQMEPEAGDGKKEVYPPLSEERDQQLDEILNKDLEYYRNIYQSINESVYKKKIENLMIIRTNLYKYMNCLNVLGIQYSNKELSHLDRCGNTKYVNVENKKTYTKIRKDILHPLKKDVLEKNIYSNLQKDVGRYYHQMRLYNMCLYLYEYVLKKYDSNLKRKRRKFEYIIDKNAFMSMCKDVNLGKILENVEIKPGHTTHVRGNDVTKSSKEIQMYQKITEILQNSKAPKSHGQFGKVPPSDCTFEGDASAGARRSSQGGLDGMEAMAGMSESAKGSSYDFMKEGNHYSKTKSAHQHKFGFCPFSFNSSSLHINSTNLISGHIGNQNGSHPTKLKNKKMNLTDVEILFTRQVFFNKYMNKNLGLTAIDFFLLLQHLSLVVFPFISSLSLYNSMYPYRPQLFEKLGRDLSGVGAEAQDLGPPDLPTGVANHRSSILSTQGQGMKRSVKIKRKGAAEVSADSKTKQDRKNLAGCPIKGYKKVKDRRNSTNKSYSCVESKIERSRSSQLNKSEEKKLDVNIWHKQICNNLHNLYEYAQIHVKSDVKNICLETFLTFIFTNYGIVYKE